MLTVEQLTAELSYDPDSGLLIRRRTARPVYLEAHKSGPRIEVAGTRMAAYKVVLALWLGKYPEKYEYRHISEDPMDLRAVSFRRQRGDGRKVCVLCGEDVVLEYFHRNPQRKDNRGSYCVYCVRQANQKRNRTPRVV
jgi:hypothetical protein